MRSGRPLVNATRKAERAVVRAERAVLRYALTLNRGSARQLTFAIDTLKDRKNHLARLRARLSVLKRRRERAEIEA